METPVLEVAVRKAGKGARTQHLLMLNDELRVVESRKLSMVTVATLPYKELSSVVRWQGLFTDGLVLKRRRGRPLVLHAMLPREAARAKTFLVGKLSAKR